MAATTSPENTMKILVASDCHIGYMEKDPVRHNDSLQTFEEILKIAHEQDVDMILLGGDLFHDNKPSRRVLHQTFAMFRRYCLGDRPCQLEFLSDQSVNFSHCNNNDLKLMVKQSVEKSCFAHIVPVEGSDVIKFPVVNYEDPNINVSYPVFSVHGNHDDPTGDGNLSAIDLLSCSGLLNHFGKASNVDDIEISPVLIQKGETKLALFGLGSIRDERLNRTFSKGKVKMLRPKEDEDNWFNIFVVHQNRNKHGPTNYLPQSYLDDFLDLIIWGHEHECLIDPQWSEEGKPFYVSQPGSSVATSLCEGESKQKHVGILHICHKAFKMTKIPLQTVRPFRMDEIVLSETQLEPDDDKKVFDFLKKKVQKMIKEELESQNGNDLCPLPPLIRLKVEYSGGYETINPHRFGQLFVDQVANSKDILLFHRRRKQSEKGVKSDIEDGIPLRGLNQLETLRMEDLIYEYLNSADQKLQLNVLSVRRMIKALREFVDKEERDAISELFKWQLTESQRELVRRNTTEGNIDEEILKVQESWRKDVDNEAEDQEIEKVLSSSRSRTSAEDNARDAFIDDDENSDDDAVSAIDQTDRSKGSSRGSGRGRGGRGRGKGTSTSSSSVASSGRGSRGRKAKADTVTRNSLLTDSFVVVSKRKPSQQSFVAESDDEDVMPTRSGFSSSRSRITIDVSDNSEDESDPFSMGPASKRGRKR